MLQLPPSLSQVVSTAVSSQAGRGSNTFIPPGREHSSAAVFAPLLPPHLISDIVTTVAACLTDDSLPLKNNNNDVWSVMSVRCCPNSCRFFSRGSGHSEAAPLRSHRPSAALRSAAAASAAAGQTMEALSAQARIINSLETG
ncbi:hypothetical protein CesoFtcFv8_008076 [Champsocephalus esox]|uniref:Uncharacterized protein n=1 Tax=Champsocephalus esox TaxID=159716 RepID=A0AAN8CFH5_9TELE|nr:hypothetical protein CesoFtcFv8_008076 [Champsocephalus esox]